MKKSIQIFSIFLTAFLLLVAIFGMNASQAAARIEPDFSLFPTSFAENPVSQLPTPVWWDEVDQASAQFGEAVRSAGDVNGDGYDDLIVGALHYTYTSFTDSGGAWLYYGSAAGYPITPSLFITPPVLNPSGFFGFSVASAGNVNGDDYDDIMVSMVNYDSAFGDEGAVFVWYGSENGPSASYDWMARGNALFSHLGWDIGTAGDVNNDGYDDIIVGAIRYDNNLISDAYVWHGSANGLELGGARPVGLPSNADWSAAAPMPGFSWGDGFGSRVGTAGDVNGDGADDVFVGAPYYDNGENNEGAVFIWYGEAIVGLGVDGTIANADWSAESDQAGALLSTDPNIAASGAGTAGDVNGDGYDDFLAGAYIYSNTVSAEGVALVWLGSADGLDPGGSRPVGNPTNADWRAVANQASAWLGFEIGERGDFNGDGFDDILVSAPYFEITGTTTITNSGAGFIWFGAEDLPVEDGRPGNADVSFIGDQENALLGWSVDWAGDVNNDGYEDVFFGARLYDNGENDEGRVYLYLGDPGPIAGLVATNDGPTVLGNLTTLTATITSGSLVTYTWDLGDSTLASGAVVTHTYASPGVYTAIVTATNAISTATASTTVFVDEEIVGLVALNNSPTIAGYTTTLTATVEAGTNISYSWDFGDDSFFCEDCGAIVYHTYDFTGTFTATVLANNSVTSFAMASTGVSIVPPGSRVYLPVVVRNNP
jgi:hypothetical protein